MGADLFRKTTTNTERLAQDAAYDALREALFAGDESKRDAWVAAYDARQRDGWYFRDSYNTSNLMRHLGLSWRDIDAFCGPNGDGIMTIVRDEDGYTYEETTLYAAGMRRLIVELESRRDQFHRNLAGMDQDDRDYFTDKLSYFTGFLHDAAEAGDTIAVSY